MGLVVTRRFRYPPMAHKHQQQTKGPPPPPAKPAPLLARHLFDDNDPYCLNCQRHRDEVATDFCADGTRLTSRGHRHLFDGNEVCGLCKAPRAECVSDYCEDGRQTITGTPEPSVAAALLEVAASIDRLADAVKGQKFATSVTAVFKEE